MAEFEGVSARSVLWNTFVECVIMGQHNFRLKLVLNEVLSNRELLSQQIGIEIPQKEVILWKNRFDHFLHEVLGVVAGFVSRKITGFSTFDDFRNSILLFLKSRGFEHPDLLWGNILVQWDDKTERLVQDEHGKAKFYVIDWESKYKPPQHR